MNLSGHRFAQAVTRRRHVGVRRRPRETLKLKSARRTHVERSRPDRHGNALESKCRSRGPTGLLRCCSNRSTSITSIVRREAPKGDVQGAIAMRNKPTILVTGAGGFIGHHLVRYLVKLGHVVRGADVKAPEYQRTDANEFVIADLRNHSECLKVTSNIPEVYHLAPAL